MTERDGRRQQQQSKNPNGHAHSKKHPP
jgi:hypothetical protein